MRRRPVALRNASGLSLTLRTSPLKVTSRTLSRSSATTSITRQRLTKAALAFNQSRRLARAISSASRGSKSTSGSKADSVRARACTSCKARISSPMDATKSCVPITAFSLSMMKRFSSDCSSAMAFATATISPSSFSVRRMYSWNLFSSRSSSVVSICGKLSSPRLSSTRASKSFSGSMLHTMSRSVSTILAKRVI